jgi:hypothetical protein
MVVLQDCYLVGWIVSNLADEYFDSTGLQYLGLCLAFTPFEQGGIFIGPHLL